MTPSTCASSSGGTASRICFSSFWASCSLIVSSESSAGITSPADSRSAPTSAGGTSSTELTPKRFDGTVRAVTEAGMPSACAGSMSMATFLINRDASACAESSTLIDLTVPTISPL